MDPGVDATTGMEPLKAKGMHEMMKQVSERALSAVGEPVKSKLNMWVSNKLESFFWETVEQREGSQSAVPHEKELWN